MKKEECRNGGLGGVWECRMKKEECRNGMARCTMVAMGFQSLMQMVWLLHSRSVGLAAFAIRKSFSQVGSFAPAQSAGTAFAVANPFRDFPSRSNPKLLKSQEK